MHLEKIFIKKYLFSLEKFHFEKTVSIFLKNVNFFRDKKIEIWKISKNVKNKIEHFLARKNIKFSKENTYFLIKFFLSASPGSG